MSSETMPLRLQFFSKHLLRKLQNSGDAVSAANQFGVWSAEINGLWPTWHSNMATHTSPENPSYPSPLRFGSNLSGLM